MKFLAKIIAVAAICVAGSLAIAPGWAAGPQVLGPQTALGKPSGGYVGRMNLSPERGPAGTIVRVAASGLPPGEDFDLVWGTVAGNWKVADGYYNGREYKPVAYRIARLRSDAQGALSTTFTTPDDFGFGHDVALQQDGRLFTQANFNLEMSMEVSPTSGPVGTPISVVVKGVGWRELENSWTLVYDNAFTGWLSSVTTHGVARFTIPATGHEGIHVLSLIHGEFTFPYLNPEQNPRPDRPRFTRTFTITPGPANLPPPVDQQTQRDVKGLTPAGELAVSPQFGPIGTPVRISGGGLAPLREHVVVWTTMVGNRVAGGGFGEEEREIGRLMTDAKGEASFAFDAPDDLGGAHAIIVKSPESQRRGAFTIVPSALPLDVAEGPAGTEFRIRLRGVGWTETANIYTVVYDNAYSGYACGFNSQGHVDIIMRATGAEGYRFIDLYPAIYKGNEARPNNFRIPQLTYADDHPGEDLPRFRYVFKITGQPGQTSARTD
jgi:hypothetical protein